MFVVQLLVPSGARWKFSMDVTVVVELASRIQDLVQNESSASMVPFGSSIAPIAYMRRLPSTASASTARPMVLRRAAFHPARYLSALLIIGAKVFSFSFSCDSGSPRYDWGNCSSRQARTLKLEN